jgi:pyruvate/2-oxoglutarate dehydrogenase complex dihydrolipoamide acyltransferase (E2) component
MEHFLIEVPIPSMGATVNELTVIALKVNVGDGVAKAQRLADLESDKSVFEFESPCAGVLQAILVKAGDVVPAGAPFLRIETSDESLRHLEIKGAIRAVGPTISPAEAAAGAGAAVPSLACVLVWTPRALKMAQEAGLDPATISGIQATGPGGRVSGDDVATYLAVRKS